MEQAQGASKGPLSGMSLQVHLTLQQAVIVTQQALASLRVTQAGADTVPEVFYWELGKVATAYLAYTKIAGMQRECACSL